MSNFGIDARFVKDTDGKDLNRVILTGSGAPTSTPSFIGQDYLDTTNKKAYKAFGTTGSSDWVAVN